MAKNFDASLGPICNNCGGYGFTYTLSNNGSASGCIHCKGTGVDKEALFEQRFRALEDRIAYLEKTRAEVYD